MPLFYFLFLGLGLGLANPIASTHETSNRKLGTAPCPLDINALRKLIIQNSLPFPMQDIVTECQYMLQGMRLLRSEYLRKTGSFSLSSNVLEACWDSYENLVNEFVPEFNIKSSCGFKTSFMSETCMNITTRSGFESLVSAYEMQQMRGSCNQSLTNSSACDSCVDSLSGVRAAYFRGPNDGNVSDCNGYPFIYAAAFANRFGPTDIGTAKCLFLLDFSTLSSSTPTSKTPKSSNPVMWGVVTGCFHGFIGAVVVVWFLWIWHKKWKKKKKRENLAQIEAASDHMEIEISGGSSSSLKLSFEEIRKAAGNFSRDNIIGMGGYGNVYKGMLADGSEVALKRFKNCSAVGDQDFAHEVEVIASVRHVNLVALRGYCIATVPSEGHQRILACELMQNGSLYDHLFQPKIKKQLLSWPIRQKIALGMARGLAYLHYGVQPAIIHRDIKASNILLDETFEPKLADFGLAKFTPEGQTHMSTRVAGTLGYVAPEYALYGQLSERIDVYSFGVVLLELLSGKKAVVEVKDDRPLLLADWAWSQVREGRALDVVDEGMPELGLPEVMEKYVMVAVLSSHPVAYARPTMDQIVKILDNNNRPIPSIPDPLMHIPLLAHNIDQ